MLGMKNLVGRQADRAPWRADLLTTQGFMGKQSLGDQDLVQGELGRVMEEERRPKAKHRFL